MSDVTLKLWPLASRAACPTKSGKTRKLLRTVTKACISGILKG
ncbi:MAG: hypothetical protein SGI98_03855 [Verrucomicrobiota bacterium]|nr:hypothetical protein [Verrucomicrobiota bacterium]